MLRANRAGARAGRGQNQPDADEPFDGRTSTTVVFPVLNQDFTTTLIAHRFDRGRNSRQRAAEASARTLHP